MPDNRRQRAWIKVQLRATSESHRAAEIVSRWKQQRHATEWLTQAILMFEALKDSTSPIHPTRKGLVGAIQPLKASQELSGLATYSQQSNFNVDDALDAVGLGSLDFS